MQKGNALIFLLVGILMFAVAGGTFYLGRVTLKPSPNPIVTSPPTAQPNPQSSPSFSPAPNETANWKIYINDKYNYELKHPADLKVSHYPGEYDAFLVYAPSEVEYLQVQFLPLYEYSIEQQRQDDMRFYRPWGANLIGKGDFQGKAALVYEASKAQITQGPEELQGKPYKAYLVYLDDKKQKVKIGYFGDGETRKLFEGILSTFKFLE